MEINCEASIFDSATITFAEGPITGNNDAISLVIVEDSRVADLLLRLRNFYRSNYSIAARIVTLILIGIYLIYREETSMTSTEATGITTSTSVTAIEATTIAGTITTTIVSMDKQQKRYQ